MSDKEKVLNDCSVEDLVRALLKKTVDYSISRNRSMDITQDQIQAIFNVLDGESGDYTDYRNPESYAGGKDQPHHTRI